MFFIQLVRPFCVFLCIQPSGKGPVHPDNRREVSEVSGDTWFESLSICLATEMLRPFRAKNLAVSVGVSDASREGVSCGVSKGEGVIWLQISAISE